MTSMEDLIATISGSMHVSQDGYDLKALQEYLAKTIVLPNMSFPTTTYRPSAPSAPSRAASVTRKPSSLPTSHAEPGYGQPLPSPMAYTFVPHDESGQTPLQRPGSLRRSSSYGFGISSQQSGYSFEADAFAPLAQEQPSSDPWARVRAQEKANTNHNPWAGFSQQPGASSFAPVNEGQLRRFQSPVRRPTPPDEDDEMMDEDRAEEGMDEIEDEESVERLMDGRARGRDGRVYTSGGQQNGWGHPQHQDGVQGQMTAQGFDRERGRRKP